MANNVTGIFFFFFFKEVASGKICVARTPGEFKEQECHLIFNLVCLLSQDCCQEAFLGLAGL